MQKEISELIHKQTWDVVDAPPDTNVIGSWWTYQLKRDVHSAIAHYKAHLVAQGFTQTHGIDYNDTFSPIAKFVSTHVVLALMAIHDWEVHQVDVKNAHLNAELTETVCMVQPPSFIKAGHESKVCKLFKALYGLKQGGRCWYSCICEAFAKFRYMCCQVKHCVFYKATEGSTIIVIVAVDNLTLASNSPPLLLA